MGKPARSFKDFPRSSEHSQVAGKAPGRRRVPADHHGPSPLGGDEAERSRSFALLRQVAVAIERLLSPYCEVVIHDFSDLERSIVHLEGSISNRSVGGGATDLLLKRVRASDTAEDLYNYRTRLANDRVMKSSTIFLRDGEGTAYGAFCINYDISALAGVHRMLSEMTRVDRQEEVTEVLSDDINKTIGTIIAETVAEIGISGPVLSRDDKIALIARLDEKGVFQVKKAVPILAEQFGFSRATIYNYLRAARADPSERLARTAASPAGAE